MQEEKAPPGQKLGRNMLYLMWGGVLVVLTFVFGVWEDKKYNPNANVQGTSNSSSRTIVLQRNNMGHYVASGVINGVPVVYMLDTGATSVAVPQSLARKLDLTPGARYPVNTANGIVEVHSTKIRKLELGPIILENISAAINPGMLGDEILLGMSVLKQLEFHQAGDKLTLTQYPAP